MFELQGLHGITFDHLTISGGYYGIYGNENFTNGSETITNNTFTSNDRAGVFLESSYGHTNTGSTIANNTATVAPGRFRNGASM